jgi:hypothetical protein
VSQPGSPERAASPPAEAFPAPLHTARTFLAVRGALAASALGVYSVVGAIGAFLALLPAALRAVPRGRAGSALPRAPSQVEASREPLAG